VPEYWVINLKAKKTVVHRSPKGSKYTSIQRVSWSSPLVSSAVPGLTVTLSDVLW
jgi:Uma2 family endonuclease